MYSLFLTEAELYRVSRLVSLMSRVQRHPFTPAEKVHFHQLGLKVLKMTAEVLEEMHPSKEAARVSSSPGGIAVLGEVTMHLPDLYVQLCPQSFQPILYRTCKSLKDFGGGDNRWAQASVMTNWSEWINMLDKHRKLSYQENPDVQTPLSAVPVPDFIPPVLQASV